MSMENMRRYATWTLALVSGISLLLAAIWSAQAGNDALRNLTLLGSSVFASHMRDALVSAGVALVTGTAAILVAPQHASTTIRFTFPQ